MAGSRVLERSVEIAAPVGDVFAFHLDPRNAGRISPPGTRISVEGDVPIRTGSRLTMRIRQLPSPVAARWRIRVEAVEPPRRIVDVAERSPFAAWRHEHIFTPLGPGRALMTDRIAYRLPAGPLGRLADLLVVRHLLRWAFAVRQRRTRELLEAGAGRRHGA